jgi:CubicO group peptidase (beta-lactamase class C family)
LTINQILSHTSGLKDEAVMNGRHDDAALGEEIRQWKADWLFTKPGAIYSYSNPGFWLAGLVVESVTGKPYADAMEELVFNPFGMKSATLRPTMAMTHPLSQGHDLVNGQPAVIRPSADNAANWPAGSIFSNVADLSRLTVALMNGGATGGVSKAMAVTTALTTPHADIPGSKAKYGYGLEVETRGTERIWSHGGSRAGYGSFITMLPDHHIAVIVLTNRSGESLPRTRAMIMEMLGFMEPIMTDPPPTSPIPSSEFAKYVGEYRNGSATTKVTAKDGKLYVGKSEAKMGPDGWLVLPGGGRVFPVPGPDGRTSYLFQSERARVRFK